MTFIEDNAKAWTEIPHLTKMSEPQPETVNGPGATMDATAKLRQQLPAFLRNMNIKSMLDVGCGDWTWMRHVDLSMLDQYIGWDVDPGQIRDNEQEFANAEPGQSPWPNLRFECQNLLSVESIPKVDLILARHVLIHFPNAYIIQILERFKQSGSKYLMTSHWPDIEANDETQPEGFAYRGYMERPVNLTLPPFNWPQPVEMLREPAQLDAAILGQDHQLAVFAIPERTFHTRVHSAADGESFSVMGVVEGWNEALRKMAPADAEEAPVEKLREKWTPERVAELQEQTLAAISVKRERLIKLRDNHRQAVEAARHDDSLHAAWLLMGAQAAAIESLFTELIGEGV